MEARNSMDRERFGMSFASETSPLRLHDFLRGHQDQIVNDWTQRMRVLSPARDLADFAIIDHLPEILRRIADVVQSVHGGKQVALGELPKKHAVDRLGRG